MKELNYKILNDIDFKKDKHFLETILHSRGVEDIDAFLNPTSDNVHSPFLLENLEEGLKLFQENVNAGKKIFLKVDADVDGFTSAAYTYQFIKKVNPDVEIVWQLNFEKRHGLKFNDLAGYEDLGFIIIPDASGEVEEFKKIKKKYDIPILILDHHLMEDRELFKYATIINCTEGKYPNPNLSGVGVVHKFFSAYCEKYGMDIAEANEFLDLVSLGLVADGMSMLDLENRYYVLEGLKAENRKNSLIEAMFLEYTEEMKLGPTIHSLGWVVAPKINGCIRYGKPSEQTDLFRALIGEEEIIEYQPKRKSKFDPLPEKEYHSLQKTMARVCKNVKARQDSEVRRFMKKMEEVIINDKLQENSIIVIDGTDIVDKKTVTGLVANKIAFKYQRPTIILKRFDPTTFGGSGRGFGKGAMEDFRQFLLDSGLVEIPGGHKNAMGIKVKEDKIEELINYCNERVSKEDLVIVYDVDYAIEAEELIKEEVEKVANHYYIWGGDVPEPMFLIQNLHINASEVKGYGERNGFIMLKYKDISFIKKYCPQGEYEAMTLRGLHTIGENKKNLIYNIIGTFTLNVWEDNVLPQIKIHYYDVREDKGYEELIKPTIDDDDFIF